MGDFKRAWTRSNSGSPSGADSNRRDSLLGTLLCVCTDCKEMVLQVSELYLVMMIKAVNM